MSADTCSGAWEAVREAPAPERVDGVDLVQDELDRELGASDLREDGLDRGDRLVQTLVRAEASATWRTRSAWSVSSSVAAKPSTS